MRSKLGYSEQDNVRSSPWLMNWNDRVHLPIFWRLLRKIDDPFGSVSLQWAGLTASALRAPQVERIGWKGRVQYSGSTKHVANVLRRRLFLRCQTQYFEAWASYVEAGSGICPS